MPTYHIEMIEGRTVEQKKKLVQEITRITVEVLAGTAVFGLAVLLVSHDLHVVMAASDRVICLNGHVCCEGAPDVVRDAPEYRALFGFGTQGALALYRHDHDHSHGPEDVHEHGPDCGHDHSTQKAPHTHA